MGMTMAEKILARASGKSKVVPGEIVQADIDLAMIHDTTGLPALRGLSEIGLDRVWDPDKVVVIFDHIAPASSENAAYLQKEIRAAVKKLKLPNFLDIKLGICHQVLPEKGFVLPGNVVVGADSHTCTYGAFGTFATGIGSTEMAAVMATGKLWFRVPQTIKLVFKGELSKGVTPKDLILATIGRVTVEGANYQAVEYSGPTIEQMDIEGRMTLSNMAIEMGAKVGLIEADEKTREFLKKRTNQSYEPCWADSDAIYKTVLEFDVSDLEPQIACPHEVDHVHPVSKLEGKQVDQVLLGSCTNGRLSDFAAAAEILKGQKVAEGVRLIVIPASTEIYLEALRKGYLEIFIEAGGVVSSPGCGPCCGGHLGIIGEGEICLSTTNRNFKGRMGKGGEIYLASPVTAAATAINGVITDPRIYL